MVGKDHGQDRDLTRLNKQVKLDLYKTRLSLKCIIVK